MGRFKDKRRQKMEEDQRTNQAMQGKDVKIKKGQYKFNVVKKDI